MIKKYTLKMLEKTINYALSLDPSAQSTVVNLQGKLLKIIVAPLNLHFFIKFLNQQVIILPESYEPPDTTISSNPIGLIKLSLLPASKARSLFNDKIKIVGDLELGQQVKTLFDNLEIDWEGHLAHFTGDLIAYQIGSFFRHGNAIKRQFTASIRKNITEYLQEELRLFPTIEEVNDFFADLDELTHATERLEARVNLLLANYETN